MRRLEIVDRVHELVRLQVKDQDFRVLLGGDEEAVACDVGGQVVEISIVKLGQWSCLQEFQGSLLLSRDADY